MVRCDAEEEGSNCGANANGGVRATARIVGLRGGRVGVTIWDMYRLLVLLQLTRAALAFTAIADAWTVLLLRMPGEAAGGMGILIVRMMVTGVVSFGLYGFGMALNDSLDAAG